MRYCEAAEARVMCAIQVEALPFCCCNRDWLSAGWGVMAGGGGSMGWLCWLCWLCWLGRARVVPTAAAEEHTGQRRHPFGHNYIYKFLLAFMRVGLRFAYR